MKILAIIRRSLVLHPVASGAFGLVALILVAIAVGVPILRHIEAEHFQEATAKSGQLLIAALSNPAVLSGDPDVDTTELSNNALELSRVHDEVVLAKVSFAKNAAQAALDYTDYAARVGAKLVQVAQTQHAARTAFDTYERDVEILKGSNLAGRPQAQEDVNAVTSEARASTELAYQECVLLSSMARDYGAVRTRALKDLTGVGPDVAPALAALDPALRAMLLASHERRKVFNPGARSPL
jgi:hypothetical protein